MTGTDTNPVSPRMLVGDDSPLLRTRKLDKIWLEVTSNCNLRCTYCHLSHSDIDLVDLDMSNFDLFLKTIKELGVEEVIFNGRGENTFLKDWHKYAEQILDVGVTMTAVSNLARRFTDEEIDVLSRFASITVSVDTVVPEIFTAIRRKADIRQVLYNIVRIQARAAEQGRPEVYFIWNMILHDNSVFDLPYSVSVGLKAGLRKFVWSVLGETAELENNLTPRQLTHLSADEFGRARRAMAAARALAEQHGALVEVSPGLTQLLENLERVHQGGHHAPATPALDANRTDGLGQPVGADPAADLSKMADRRVPDGFVRDCVYPWREAFIHADRGVRVCCTSPVIASIGADWDFDAVVNGPEFRKFRQDFLNGRLDKECHVCPIKEIVPLADFRRKMTDLLEGPGAEGPGRPAAAEAAPEHPVLGAVVVDDRVIGKRRVLGAEADMAEALEAMAGQPFAPLLEGILECKRGDTWAAAEAFTRWAETPSPAFHAELLADGNTVTLHAYGPAVNPAAPSREEVLRTLASIHWGAEQLYSDAAALAVSKLLGKAGRWEEAQAFLIGARDSVASSRIVRACLAVVALALEGEEIPDYLRRYVGDDTGALKNWVCPLPFRRFDISSSGDVLVCCGHWLPTSIGNVLADGPDAVLNSDTAHAIRRSVINGRYNFCDMVACQNVKQGLLYDKDTIDDPVIRDAIDNGNLDVQHPHHVIYGLDRSCNLSCPSCRREVEIEKGEKRERNVSFTLSTVLPLLKHAKVVQINPAGELLASRSSRELLAHLNKRDYPELMLDIITNGTLFSEKEWNKFPGIHDMVHSIRVSLDGATGPTFEKLRRGGKWDEVWNNLKFIQRLKDDGVIDWMILSFTYQRDNFREMLDFIRLGEELGVYRVKFERLQNMGSFTHQEYLDRAVHLPDHPLHEEFLKIVRHPDFGKAMVEHEFDFAGLKPSGGVEE